MLAAIEAFEGGAVLAFPALDYRRLSHAVQAAIRAHQAILAQQRSGGAGVSS